MIIHIWLSTLMHFMHAAQMIFLLDVCMLIIESSFYSLTTSTSMISLKAKYKSLKSHFINFNTVKWRQSKYFAYQRRRNIFSSMLLLLFLHLRSLIFFFCRRLKIRFSNQATTCLKTLILITSTRKIKMKTKKKETTKTKIKEIKINSLLRHLRVIHLF